MFRAIIVAISAIVVGATLGAPASARFSLSPARMIISPGERQGSVVVSNLSDTELVVEISASRWFQDEAGEDIMGDDDTLLVFPRQATIPARGSQVVRVGLPSSIDVSMERAYRLLISEIPVAEPNQADVLRVLVAMSMPAIFLSTSPGDVQAEVTDVRFDGDRITFRITNQSPRFFRISEFNVAILDGQNRELSATAGPGWYVLAGASRRFSVDAERMACGDAERVVLTLSLDGGRELTRSGLLEAVCR